MRRWHCLAPYCRLLCLALLLLPAAALAQDRPDPAAEAAAFAQGLEQAVQQYADGDVLAAAEVGDLFYTFEESGFRDLLAARDPDLYKRFEAQWLTVRRTMKQAGSTEEVRAELDAMLGLIEDAREVTGAEGGGAVAFWGSFLIIFREGFEALLIIGALAAYLRKIEAGEKVRDLYVGGGVAVVASLGLWALAKTVIRVSGAQAEIIEGATMLLATVVLFYISYWLISKVQHAKWDAFIRRKMARAVSGTGGRASLLAVSFLVVFREGFETVLFYEALGVSTSGAGGTLLLLGGFAVGVVALAALWLAIKRLGMRLPFGAFFGGTSALLYWMAFKFAGDGMRELQEALVLSETAVPWFPDSAFLKTWLGMYPFVQTLALQAVLLAAVGVGLIIMFWPRQVGGGQEELVEVE